MTIPRYIAYGAQAQRFLDLAQIPGSGIEVTRIARSLPDDVLVVGWFFTRDRDQQARRERRRPAD